MAESVGSPLEYFSNCKIQIKNGTIVAIEGRHTTALLLHCYLTIPLPNVNAGFFCAGSATRPTS